MRIKRTGTLLIVSCYSSAVNFLINLKLTFLPDLIKLGFIDGMSVPKYATVFAGLKMPVLPLFNTPFHNDGLSDKGLNTK